METRDVLFHFKCYGNPPKTLDYKHALPTHLITANPQSVPDYGEQLVAATQPIMEEHSTECLAASQKDCQFCSAPAIKVLQNMMSYLRIVENPFAYVLVAPICGKKECEKAGRSMMQDLQVMLMSEQGEATDRCQTCGKAEDTRKCSRCKAVAYCSKECQRLDWKGHKPSCRTPEERERLLKVYQEHWTNK